MKSRILAIALLVGGVVSAQINLPSAPTSNITQQNPFLDASGYNSSSNNIGKGLYFPKTNLTTWEFKTESVSARTFRTYYDGMMVYNSGDGQTIADASKGGQQVSVKPGFYYFKNPNKNAPRGNVNDGKWVRLAEEDAPVKVGSTTGVTCNEGNLGTISFGDVTVSNNARKAFGFCTKDANNAFVWVYMVAGNHMFSSSNPEFGKGL